MKQVKQLAKQILQDAYLMSLATIDENGPWVSDITFVADQFTIYWVSRTDARHSIAIEKDGRCAATMTVNNDADQDNIGIQVVGKAVRLDTVPLKIAKAHRAKRKRPIPKTVQEVLIEGQAWYSLKPTRIDVIYEPLWGFNKQTIAL